MCAAIEAKVNVVPNGFMALSEIAIVTKYTEMALGGPSAFAEGKDVIVNTCMYMNLTAFMGTVTEVLLLFDAA